MKSTQSEDLSKDLLRNLRISPQKCEGFHDLMNQMNRIEIKGNDLTQTDLRSESDLKPILIESGTKVV